MIASAANGGGTKMTEASAPVLSTASSTVLNTGQPSVVIADPVPGGLDDAAYTAEAGCPEEAIAVEPRRPAHAGQARS